MTKIEAEMMAKELEHMPKALRILANAIQAPDEVPAMCLRDAARMIENLRMQVADAVAMPQHLVPESAKWLTKEELAAAVGRRDKQANEQSTKGDEDEKDA